MNIEIDHLGNIKEITDNETGMDECTSTSSFHYVDINNYNDHSFEDIDVKQEEEYVEDLVLERNVNVCKNNEFFVEENFPLNTIKNLANHSQDEISIEVHNKTNKQNFKNSFVFSSKSTHQKENVSVKCELSNTDKINVEPKRYKLRTRTLSKKLDYKLPKYSIRNEKTVNVSCKKKNSCNKCRKTFLSKSELEIHKAEEVNFRCHKCTKCFCSNTFLNSHNKVCIGSSKNNNSNVELGLRNHKEFLNRTHLKKNFKNHKLVFSCEKCSRSFKKKVSLESHILQNECEFYICAHCDLTFAEKKQLKTHVKVHLNKSVHDFGSKESLSEQKCKKSNLNICHICDKKFLQLSRLKTHLLHHKGISYKCAKCKKSFASQINLDNHSCKFLGILKIENQGTGKLTNGQKTVQNDNCDSNSCGNSDLPKLGDSLNGKNHTKKNRYKCDTCGREFIKFVRLKIHILNIHQGINYQCDKCSTKFPSQEDLDLHLTKHDCKAENLWMCNTCGKVFAKRDYLKKHQYVHMNILFKCKYCYCAFMKEKSYKRHMEKMNCSKSARKIKMSEYNYKKCRICGLEYETEELLIKHFKTSHINLEPHQCFCCESCLPTFRDLQNHIHHHNIQKYTCNLCGKPYTSQEGFRKHRLKHKGAEFKCRFCNAEFLNESRFRFHEKTCKKNPESGYEPSDDREKQRRKDGRPKQSRQLHWESRIIVKHLRGDPKTCVGKQENGLAYQQESSLVSTFFDESETESTNEKGWFDKYYKTEEDDLAFGVKKTDGKGPTDCDTDFEVSNFLQNTDSLKKKKSLNVNVTLNSSKDEENDINAEDYWSGSSSEAFSTSSDEGNESTVLPFDYNPKKCRLCLIIFSQEYELLHHFIKAHPDEYAHKCPQCGVQSPLFAQLKEHMKSHGIGIGVFNCDNCSKQFKNEKKMKIHKIRCKGMNSAVEPTGRMSLSQTDENRCKKCGKNFHTKFGYRRHKQLCKKKVKNKHLEKSDRLPAEKPKDNANDDNACDDGFLLSDSEEDIPKNTVPEKNNLVKNEGISAEKSESPDPVEKEGKTTEMKSVYPGEPPADSFPCRLCDKKFQYERGLVMHFKSAHPGNKPLVCHVCNMHLADKLKEHLKTHGIGEEFICELCGKRFNQKFLSKIHEMWHQGIEYKCSNCKQKFLNKEKMDKHIRENRCSNRQSLMRLPCDICGKSYRSKFGLNKHYITHTPKELRPVKNRMNCEYCGKWFENNNGLQRHRRIHTGERPFCCRFCPKAFAQEGNCKAHERIHTGESKPRKKKFPPVPSFTASSLPPPPPLSPHFSSTLPSSQLPPSLISQTPPPPPLSPHMSGAAAEQVTYPGHVDLFIYSTVDPAGIVN